MAELPHLGKQCHVCNQLDFLPITCFHCNQTFCKDHATAIHHKCTPDIELKKDELKGSKPNPSDYTKCIFCSTTVSILESITCIHCKKRFCLQHRHKVDHNCESLSQPAQGDPELQKRKALVESILKRLDTSSGVTIKKRGKKNDALAQRVAAMKLKSTSVGQQSIPLDERLYFYLTFVPNDMSYDQDHKVFEEKPIYLCKEWSIGKCVDWIATNFALVNRNNEASQAKLVITTEHLLRHDSNQDEVNYCCDNKHIYFCFGHELKYLESNKVIVNTDKLLVTYFKL